MAKTLTLKNLLEAGLGADPLPVEQRLAEIPADIDASKREGRPCSWWTPTWWPICCSITPNGRQPPLWRSPCSNHLVS